MAMGIVTDDQFQDELNKFNKQKDKIDNVIPINYPGRKDGDLNVPQGLREIIAEESIHGTPSAEIIRSFPISKSSVSAYKIGATSTSSYDQPQSELVKSGNLVRERITKRASRKLLKALDSITDDKLDALGAEKASGVARDMSQIIRNMEPEKSEVSNTQNNIIYYSPRMRTEEEFDSIQLNEV